VSSIENCKNISGIKNNSSQHHRSTYAAFSMFSVIFQSYLSDLPECFHWYTGSSKACTRDV